jgi:hypothetical protein
MGAYAPTTDGRGGKSWTRGFIAIIVVVIVVSASMGAVFVLIELGVVDWSDDSFEGFEQYEIYVMRDETWSGRDEVMTRPIHIEQGATLTIADSHLEVRMEDIVLKPYGESYRIIPWFSVGQWSSLNIVNSTLSLMADPRLETAVVLEEHSVFLQDVPVSLSRAVNLVEATAPVLHFEVQWRHESNRLKVAVQEAPGEEPRVLATFYPSGDEVRSWVHYIVPLDAYTGTVPRVLIFPDPGYHTLIANLWLLDGNEQPPGDIPWTGCAALDGWNILGFAAFYDHVHMNMGFEELIDVQGNLTVDGSRIEGPENITRRYVSPSSATSKYGLPDEDPDYWNIRESERGGHIHARGANLTIARSQVRFVPIAMDRSVLDISDTTLVGGGDLLVIHNGTAAIEGVTFRSTPWQPSPILKRLVRLDDMPMPTALSISSQGPAEPSSVRNSTFLDSEIAVEVTRSGLAVDGCTFLRTRTLAVWDHEATGLGSPEGLLVDNAFTDCSGHWLLRTHDAAFDVVEEWRPVAGEDPPYVYGTIANEEELGYPPITLLFDGYKEVRMFMPEVVVDANGTVFTPDSVELSLNTDYCGPAEVAVNTSSRSGSVSLPYVYPSTGWAPDWRDLVEVYSWLDPGDEAGELVVSLRAEAWNVFLTEVELEIAIDGVSIGSFDVPLDPDTDFTFDGEYSYRATKTVALETGPSGLDMVIKASTSESEGMEVVWENTLNLLRLSIDDEAALATFLAGGGDTVLLDPDARVSLANVELGANDYDGMAFLTILAQAGAHLDLSRLTGLPEKGLFLYVAGDGSVAVSDSELAGLTVYQSGSTVKLANLTVGLLDVFGEDATLTCLDSIIKWDWLSLGPNHTVELERVQVEVGDEYVTVDEGSGLEMRDCRLFSRYHGFLGIRIGTRSSVDVEGSTFENATLLAHVYDDAINWSLGITGCDFLGGRPALMMMPYWAQFIRYDPTLSAVVMESNRFVGDGAGLMMPASMARHFHGSNEMVDGARMYAWYGPHINVSGEVRKGVRKVLEGDASTGWPYDTLQDNDVSPGGHYVDVTSDPGLFDTPPEVLVVTFQIEETPWHVSGSAWVNAFTWVALSSESIQVEPPEWEWAGHAVYPLLEHKPKHYVPPDDQPNWWEG